MNALTTAAAYGSLGLGVGMLLASVVYYALTSTKFKHANAQLLDKSLLYQEQLAQIIKENRLMESQVRAIKAGWSAADNRWNNTVATKPAAYPAEFKEMRHQVEHFQRSKRALEQLFERKGGYWNEERARLTAANDELRLKIASHGDWINRQRVGLSPGLADAQELERLVARGERTLQLLQQQVSKLKTDKKALETVLAVRANQSERKKQELEDEIERLFDRIIRIGPADPSIGRAIV